MFRQHHEVQTKGLTPISFQSRLTSTLLNTKRVIWGVSKSTISEIPTDSVEHSQITLDNMGDCASTSLKAALTKTKQRYSEESVRSSEAVAPLLKLLYMDYVFPVK